MAHTLRIMLVKLRQNYRIQIYTNQIDKNKGAAIIPQSIRKILDQKVNK